ncbi:hypothetical protein [Candidatus Lokiarchaeum ossiferum]
MVSVLEDEKKNLERERNRLLKEIDTLNSQIKQFSSIVETTNQTLQAKEESLLSKEKQLQNKDLLINEKDQKLEEYRKQFELQSEEKVKKFEELSAFMEKMSNEKVSLVEQVANLEKKIADYVQKIKTTKEKSRAAQDGLLGASMEMEKVREEASKINLTLQETIAELEQVKKEKNELETKFGISSADLKQSEENDSLDKVVIQTSEINKYKERIASLELSLEKLQNDKASEEQKEVLEDEVFSMGTGTYKSISALIAHFKFKLTNVRRTIRIILPELSVIERFGLTDVFNDLPKNILKNLACNVDHKHDKQMLNLLQENNFRVTNYQGTKLFALSIDNITAALAVYDEKEDNITGIFSNNEELVRLLSQAIMNPFIKGVKLN